MSIRFENLFPTVVAQGTLENARALNPRLLRDIDAFSKQDQMGRKWSKTHYRGGYTSYASLSDLQFRAPSFSEFAETLQPQAEAFAKAQGWDLRGMKIEMTALWMNVMPKNTYHTLHFHPHSAISGAYYVQTPPDSISLKLEDPRMPLFMNAPLKKEGAKNSAFYREIKPTAGNFILFDAWLRHEVPPNLSKAPRISLSFNYSLEPK